MENLENWCFFDVETVTESLIFEAIEFEDIEVLVGYLIHEGKPVDDGSLVLAHWVEDVLKENKYCVVGLILDPFVFESFCEL